LSTLPVSVAWHISAKPPALRTRKEIVQVFPSELGGLRNAKHLAFSEDESGHTVRKAETSEEAVYQRGQYLKVLAVGDVADKSEKYDCMKPPEGIFEEWQRTVCETGREIRQGSYDAHLN
jgi:hypothetical protein